MASIGLAVDQAEIYNRKYVNVAWKKKTKNYKTYSNICNNLFSICVIQRKKYIIIYRIGKFNQKQTKQLNHFC